MMLRILAGIIVCMVFCTLNSKNTFGQGTIIQDHVHYSEVFKSQRNYRIFLPSDYHQSEKRYPVIYFFHGYAGRFNGPAEGEGSVTAETRYYDEFNGDIERCGADSLDNFAEFVSENDVIIVKWDGYVKDQYPRPYDIGPVKDDLQFTAYFEELVMFIDKHYRTKNAREGRAVSGFSMGGFMSILIALKYPHMISSASFFCPSSAFTIGPVDLQVYTPFKDVALGFKGLPMRMHIGQNDFLRQYHYQMEEAFKDYDLYYEGWHYGANYFGGFHNVANIKGQFDFHVKYFNNPMERPKEWHHFDPFPQFNKWGCFVESNRKVPGFTILENVSDRGFKIYTRKWLPDGPGISGVDFEIETDTIYEPNETYEVAILKVPDEPVVNKKIKAGDKGRIALRFSGERADVGIYKQGGPGHISLANYDFKPELPQYGNEVELKAVLFNKGGQDVDSVKVEVVSQVEGLEVIDTPILITQIKKGEVYDKLNIRFCARNKGIRDAVLKLRVEYENKTEVFWLEVPFFNPEFELKTFAIADGKMFYQERSETGGGYFGDGNGNGAVDPGERISILTTAGFGNENWYGLKLYTDDPYVEQSRGEIKYHFRNDWSGAMRATSEVYISPNCPDGHVIKFYGEYDYQNKGNIPRDDQAAHSFIHEREVVLVQVEVGKKY